MKKIIFFLFIYGLLTTDYGLISADTINLKDGRELKGIVVEDYHDRLVFSTPDGEVSLMKADIRELFLDSEEDNLIKLAEQASRREDYQRAYAYYNMAYKLNPDSKPAKDGMVFLQGYLFRSEQVKKEADVRRMEEVERFGAVSIPDSDEAAKFKVAEAKLKESMGMTIASDGSQLKVTGVGSGMSASEAGIKKGDLLVSVWGKLTGYMPLSDVMDILLDKPSLEIKCTIQRYVDIRTRHSYDIRKVLGASLAMEFDGLTVSAVEEGGPAFMAGLKQGDLITAINGKSTRYMPIKKAIQAIKRSKNKVEFTIQREVIIWRRR